MKLLNVGAFAVFASLPKTLIEEMDCRKTAEFCEPEKDLSFFTVRPRICTLRHKAAQLSFESG